MKVMFKKKYDGFECMVVFTKTDTCYGQNKLADYYDILLEEPEGNDSDVSSRGWLRISHHKTPETEWHHDMYTSGHEYAFVQDVYKDILSRLLK